VKKSEPEPKERVLHARIPESLDEAIRARAAGLGMSVSNLVRNVLANALEVVEASIGRRPDDRPSVVLGWHEAVLARNAVCDRCNAILPSGSPAAISIVEPATIPRPIRCMPCLEEIRR
jgi:hypothetical protein